MKIKNMKLMLLGLIGLMSASNASAAVTAPGAEQIVDGVKYEVLADGVKQDENGRSVSNIVYNLYTITWTAKEASKSFETKEAYVIGVRGTATDAEVATLAIPAEVAGDKGTYKVVEIDDAWNAATKMKDVKAVTTSLSIDITNLKATLSAEAYKPFTALTSLTITDASTSVTPLTSSFSGKDCGFTATLTTLDLSKSRITEIAAEGLKNYKALTAFDFTGITKIGANAFENDYGITTVTIPASVIAIGDNAFKGMYYYDSEKDVKYGLTTLTINGAQNTYSGKTLTGSKIPAAFSGNGLLASVTVGSTTATQIDADAFAGAPLTSIDLSGATALATITGAFPTGCALTSVKLYGTNLTNITDIDFSGAKATLATLTFPKKLASLTKEQFKNFVALTELDLSVTAVKAIPDAWCEWSASSAPTDAEGQPILPVLTTVKLNPETTTIGDTYGYSFSNQIALATVTGLNQDKLTTLYPSSFNGTAMTEVDLSAATNPAFTTIPRKAFGNMANLATITLPAQISTIATAAFVNDGAVTSINLEDLKNLKELNPMFHDGVVGVDAKAEEIPIPITSLILPDGGAITTINKGALQLLDITEIDIPATVTTIDQYALQGNIKLQKFTWNDSKQRKLYDNTFRGDDHLQKVKMITTSKSDYAGISILDKNGKASVGDVIFKGNKKDVLTVYVNAEDFAVLVAQGWSEANLKYCTLSAEGEATIEFTPSSKTGEYYYKTYYSDNNAAWFPEEDFEVFSAVVDGSDVVLNPAATEGGYYKVARFDGANAGDAVCVIRSKKSEADYQIKNAEFNNISTMPTDNDLQIAPAGGKKASRLSFQYILGVKGGVVAFYRLSSGTIDAGKVFIESKTPADRLNIVLEGEATAINGVATKAAENNGAIYNLNGVRVKSAQKGVYIQNGKKFVK